MSASIMSHFQKFIVEEFFALVAFHINHTFST